MAQPGAPDPTPVPDDADASPAHAGWVLAATMLASSLAFIDGSVTNVALPSIGRDLHGDAASLQWIVNAYLLPLSALLLVGGAAGDHFGRRRMLILGTALFAAASVLCALAPGLPLLLAARAAQGVGAAMLMPNSLGILGASFRGEARGRAVGTWASAGAIASAVGPPLGGWLVGAAGWRAIFLINVPVALVAILLAWRHVEESAEGEQPLDVPGAILATLALGTLTWALTLWSSTHAGSPRIWAGLIGGVLLLTLFVWVEHRRHGDAMMPLAMFASRPFVGLTLLTFLLYGALGGLLVLLPYLLIVGGGYSPLHAGLALLPFSLVIGAASRLMGRTTERIGPRWPLTVGPIVTGLGFLLLVRVDPTGSYWTSVMPGMIVVALGMAGAVAPLTTAVLSSVDQAHTGTASGFNSAIARTGGLIATALAGAVIAQTGAALVETFRSAAILAAALAVAAGCVAFATLGSLRPARAGRTG
ncbi:MFS transporter [Sphingomonas sp. CD22]|uniref:MFS transporter n=1 Tax=Sphingomonas sp. CD22 TaxID=3100214 RepID=UPI002ADFCF38|nr:MFS transporter [Sphingomonas sp. CD22]MEA1083185.1 MFS transporter [Sphingomonas sp. CD22]